MPKRTCADCGRNYYTSVNSPYDVCLLCLSDLEEAGVNPRQKQPADKGDYRPRYNGMKPFGE